MIILADESVDVPVINIIALSAKLIQNI